MINVGARWDVGIHGALMAHSDASGRFAVRSPAG